MVLLVLAVCPKRIISHSPVGASHVRKPSLLIRFVKSMTDDLGIMGVSAGIARQ